MKPATSVRGSNGGACYGPEFRGTGFNRSQAAMAKLGATRERLQRADRIIWTDLVRDTALIAILKEEWPV
ncbi:MAG TPA: hypothetical protein VNA29_02295 [Sphingomicrobium sp.]|nr:hypothetical protein [Sphingomicrobium sp.]